MSEDEEGRYRMPPITIPPTTPRMRGSVDCYQDRCENVPFSSVGGLDARGALKRPKWIKPEEEEEYLAGYREMALSLYGEDWATCSFSWRPVLTIPGRETGD